MAIRYQITQRIEIMKTLRYFFAIAASALMMFSCQKDAEIDNIINGGKLTFRLEIPEIEQVEVTRGAVEETEAYNVSLFIFNVEGVRVATEKFDLTPTNENSYTRIYEHESTTSLSAGTYDIYAIANTSSNALWNGISQFDGVLTKDEFEAIALTMTGVENTSTRMTLSGHTTYTVSGANSTLAVNMQLSRPYAKVTFNVKNGTVNPNFTFTPTSYDIYNVPAQSRMFESSTNDVADYKTYTGRAIGQSGSFEYWQMENSFDVVSGLTKYTEREKRVSDSDRTFAFAPANSTYVVIYGEAIEKDANGNTVKNAKVNYTIHLGDFSPSGSVGNFSVDRNTHYTYNVTVNGVDKIEVEAKRENGEYENGAEGTIIDMTASKQVYNLDAHYETVLLQLDVDALHIAGIDAMTLSVSTPIMEPEYKNKTVGWSEIKTYVENGTLDEFYAMYDATWVEFLPVSSAQFVAYPGVNEDGTPKGGQLDICSLMKAIEDKTLPEAADGLNYVVAFVNEFYYDDWDWPVFVNKQEGREMKILQSPEISTDQHSVYSQALCAFQQKSISTMFSVESDGNVFGIEMYDETGDLDINTSRAGSDQNNGWANTKSYMPTSWGNVIRVRMQNGTSNSEDYTAGSEINQGYGYDGQPNGNKYVSMVSVDLSYGRDYDAAYACMQRNRDNNGNGTIDDDEIRWYMPAINQLAGFWYGEEALPTYARLFQGQTTDVKNEAEYKLLHHYYTSTSGNYRIFWAIEGSSYGADNRDASNGANSAYNYQSTTHYTRCIRNLQTISGAPADIVTPDGNVATINGFTDNAYRLNTQSGQYPAHNERDIANKLPKAFKMATADLSTSTGAVSYTIKAPQISSAVSSNGKTILTFASVENGVNYYYTTTEAAAQTNPITVENNQATINIDFSESMAAPDVTNISTTRSGAFGNRQYTVTLTFSSTESGLDYYYTTSENFSLNANNKLSISNNQASIAAGNQSNGYLYIWAYNPNTQENSLYTRIRYYYNDNSEQTITKQTPISTIYVWAYSTTYSAYSNATTITANDVEIGEDKTDTVGNASSGNTFTMLQATTQPLCSNYYEESDQSDKGMWRVPNQRELTIMTTFYTSTMDDYRYLSSTTFSNQNVGENRYSYCNRDNYNQTYMTLQASDLTGRIRCVRDVEVNNGSMGEGGGIN